MTAAELTNAELSEKLAQVKLAPAKYVDTDDLFFDKTVVDEAVRRLGDPLKTCSNNKACDSLKEMVAARDREIGLLTRKLAEAVKALETVASLDCRKKCTILQRGNAADCLNCNSIHAHGSLTRIQEMT